MSCSCALDLIVESCMAYDICRSAMELICELLRMLLQPHIRAACQILLCLQVRIGPQWRSTHVMAAGHAVEEGRSPLSPSMSGIISSPSPDSVVTACAGEPDTLQSGNLAILETP